MLVSIGVSGINHLIGHFLRCECFPSISCFDSYSRAHFHSESVQRFIYYNQFQHYALMDRVLLLSTGVSGINHLVGHIFMTQMVSFNFGF